jgi:hypothetical protein
VYLFRPFAFARDLGAGRVTEGTKVLYLGIGILVPYAYGMWYSAYEKAHIPASFYGIQAIVFGATLYLAFRANASGDNRRFVERYACLSSVATVWLQIVGIVVAMAFYFRIGRSNYVAIQPGMNLVSWGCYSLAVRHLVLVAARQVEEPPPLPAEGMA